MLIEDRKIELAKKLKEEKDALPEYSIFGEKNSLKGYDEAIEYLTTGKMPQNMEDFDDCDVFLGVVEDLEMMFNDYSV